MLTAALAVLCALLVLVLLVQRPAIWPVLVVLAVLWLLKMFFGVNIPAPKQLPRLPLPQRRSPVQE